MNKYHIRFLASDENGHIFFNEMIDTTSLVELFAKLLIQSARLNDELVKRKLDEDDIPF
jgi:hypothetical protein